MKRFFVVACVVLMAACAREQQVVIVSTNDIHSSTDNFGRLATLVENLRSEHRGRVLLVDAGDRWTGNPFVDLAERPLSPVVELMNALGYDVATLGNHEFDWGQALLRERIDEMNFPVVCANISSREAELGYIPPFAVIEMDGMTFGFLGLVTNFSRQGRPEGKAEHFEGLAFPDVFETAGEYAWLADSVDVFVGLTHIGAAQDTVLARRVPGLDLILGGDSHTRLEEPLRVGNVLVTQTGSGLKYAGITTVTRQRRGSRGGDGDGMRGGSRGGNGMRGGGITIENRLVMLDTVTSMPSVDSMVARYNANPALWMPIGRTAAPFDERGVENLVTDAIRDATGADVALYHMGGIRIDTLAGDISTADLHRIEPFLSEVYTLHLTPGQIKGMIMAKFNNPNPKESHVPDIVPGGFSYTIVTDEAGEATDVVFEGAPRVGPAGYLVAMPDYLYKNYTFDRSEDAVETRRRVTSVLHDHIARRTPLEPDNRKRIVIK